MTWHQMTIVQVISELQTSISGLSDHAAAERTAVYGMNDLQTRKRKTFLELLLRQFGDFMILILIVAAGISGVIGNITDAAIIFVIIILNAFIGSAQEYRAAQAIALLRQMATPFAYVLRDGQMKYVPAATLVPGDMVVLEAGDIVPADIRLTEVYAFRLEESALTGEANPVDKSTGALANEGLVLGERSNMAYRGTKVVYGRARGLVVATGMDTELGRIAEILQEDSLVTPLQRRMNDFGKRLSWTVLGICLVLFVTGLIRGEQPFHMLLLAISLAVAAIPEALPALITIALAFGAKKMAKQNALIRKLPAVEVLGSVTFICTDKTGTLTQNKMTVTELRPFSTSLKPVENLSLLECAMAVNHDVKYAPDGKVTGDPTETALVDYIIDKYSRATLQQINDLLPRVTEIPFDSERKCMTTIHRYQNGFLVIGKGAPEKIADMLSHDEALEPIHQEVTLMAENGMRVLAFGFKIIDSLPVPLSADAIENNFHFAGLAGMTDPPRAEVRQAMAECRSAGITPVMITGDHMQTAVAVGKQIGLLREGDLAVSGQDLAEMSDEELLQKVEHISIYARVSPLQKLNIVKALQYQKQFVAMTGDGVNDAPALSVADIGIAMGRTGTDVSKESAHMILLDDNFATIVKAVREGRRIYNNIRKFIKYILTCNGAEICIIFFAPLFGLPNPLLPTQVLWINLVTDSLPGLALAGEKAEADIMDRPPGSYAESIFSEGAGRHIILAGLFMAAITLGTQAFLINADNEHWQTIVFTVLSLTQLAQVFAIRSDHEFVYRKGLFSNPLLFIVIVFTFFLQMAVVYLPWGNKIFKTQPLSAGELLTAIGIAVIVFHMAEFEKWVFRSGRFFDIGKVGANIK